MTFISIRIFAMTGSPRCSWRAEKQREDETLVGSGEELLWQNQAERGARHERDHDAADRDRSGASAFGDDELGVGLEAGEDQQHDHAEPT